MTAVLSAARTRVPALLLALLLVSGSLALLAPRAARADAMPADPTNPATPITATADPLPTAQINGIVWSQTIVGNTVYAAGRFTRARPAGAPVGTAEVVRNNLLAYDIRTGELIQSFQPDLNGQALVVTASPDGSRIYVGGDFTLANGQVRNRIAAYSTATGALISTFRPSVGGQVRAIAATDSTVYFGGGFAAVGTQPRHRLAAVSASNGALLAWAPRPGTGPVTGNRNGDTRTSDHVMGIVLTGNGSQVVVAGRFDTMNGVKATGVTALDPTTAAVRPFAINQLLTNQGINSAVYSLSTDGAYVYGTAYDYWGPGNLEGSFKVAAGTGALQWVGDCQGDSYSSAPMNGALYVAGHPHVCSNIGGFPEHNPRIHRYAIALSLAPTGTAGYATKGNTNFRGKPTPTLLPWFPTMTPGTVSGAAQAGWSVAADDRYVVYGGEFPRVNGRPQQGLVRYALPSLAPNDVAPTATGFAASAVAVAPGTVRVGWRATSDQDNENLTYSVYRDGATTTPVHTVTKASTFWDRPAMAFVDRGVSAGTHTYRVSAVDPAGNRINTAWVTVQVAAGTTPARPYVEAVRADGAEHLWSFGERTAGVARDEVGSSDLTVGTGVTRGASGVLAGDADRAYAFNGTTSGLARTSLTEDWALNTVSIEAWFRTTSTTGGKIIGFGNRPTGASTSFDRHIYMDGAGRVAFGVYPGERRWINTGPGYNNGAWHHVVATLGRGGMALYVDGRLAASRADTTYGQAYSGFWRIGGDTTWADGAWFNGSIDEVAVYPTVLPADRVAAHNQLGRTGQGANTPPTAAFATAAADLTASFDASASTDADGTIGSWSWTFGDGSTGSGQQATHAYAAPGSYPVVLTVTDDDGAVSTVTRTVTVTAPQPNAAPRAAFQAAMAGRTGTFDASSSADPDGGIASYAWDFGDGTTATGARATHTYAAEGTYTVTVTVTDDDGATGTAQRVVSATGAEQPAVVVADAFDRQVTGGLGRADVGGAWTASSGPTRQSVSAGAATLALVAPGNTTGAALGEVSETGADVRTRFALSAAPTGGGTYVYVRGRVVGTLQEYRARLRMVADGRVAVAFTRLTGTATEALIGGEVVVPGLTYVPGAELAVRVQVSGAGTTSLAATVWPAGSPEPATPTVVRTDTTPSLQAAGSVGISAYQSGSATAPVDVRFADLTAARVAG